MTVAVAFCVIVQNQFHVRLSKSSYLASLSPTVAQIFAEVDFTSTIYMDDIISPSALVRILLISAHLWQQTQHRFPCTSEESRSLLQARAPRNCNSAAQCASRDQPPVHLHQEGIIHTYTQPSCPLTETTQAILGRQEDFRCICGTIS